MTIKSKTVFYEKGDLIFNAGDVANCAYIIESGIVGLYSMDNSEEMITSLAAGELLGEMGVIDDSLRLVSAFAETDLELLEINKSQITQRLQNSDPIIRTVMNVLLNRIRRMTDHDYIHAGANSRVVHSSQNIMLSEGMHKIRFEKDLYQALENGDVINVYQPMVDLTKGHIAGFEALSRWKHPDKGMISPFEFISLAEESDLIISMGFDIFDKACEKLKEFQAVRTKAHPELPDLFMSINVSVAQLSDGNFLNHMQKTINKYNVNPANIKIEITESMLVEYEKVKKWINSCHDLGFQISLDDFGTGYSGFQHLLELEFDNLKIDKAFIMAIATNPKSLIMLEVITNMAKRLNMSIVAEGIETLEGAIKLAELGVQYGQGYYFYKPMKSDNITPLLES